MLLSVHPWVENLIGNQFFIAFDTIKADFFYFYSVNLKRYSNKNEPPGTLAWCVLACEAVCSKAE